MTARRPSPFWPLAAALVAVPALALLVLQLWPQVQLLDRRLAQASAFISLGGIGWVLVVTLLLPWAVRRRWSGGVAILVALLALLATVLPMLPTHPNEAAQPELEVRIATLNARYGGADPAATARFVEQADLVVLTEATPAFVAAVGSRLRGFDHRAGDGAAGPAGTVVWSRFPIRELEQRRLRFEQRVVEVDLPDGSAMVLAGVHPVNPMSSAALWAQEAEQVRELVEPRVGQGLVVIGDFNATAGQWPIRRLTDLGLRDVAIQTGAVWSPTYPANRRVPAMIRIDAAFVDDTWRPLALRTVEVPGTDHRGVLVELGR